MAKYLKQDSELGYIEDSADIQYHKFNNLRHTILGCMLGDFDENGEYVLAPEIAKELIAMRKYIVETVDNIEICHGCLKLDKYITFLVTFEGNKATLSLVEKLSFEANFKINSGTYSNVNEYILDEVETSGEIDKNVIYKRWNIDVFGGNYLDVFNMDEETLSQYFGIVNRFKYLMMANEALLNHEEDLEEIESNYSLDMLELISRYPKLKEAIIKEINESMQGKEELIRIDKPYFAKTLNELISKTVEDNINLLTEEEKKDFDVEKHNIQTNYNNKINEKLDIVARPQSTDEKELDSAQTIILDVHSNPETANVVEVAKRYVKMTELVERRTRQEAVAFITGEVFDAENKPLKPGDEGKSPYKSKLIESIIGEGVGTLDIYGRRKSSSRLTLFEVLRGAIGLPIERHTGKETGEIISSRKLISREIVKTKEESAEKVLAPAGTKSAAPKKKAGKGPAKQKAKKAGGTKGQTAENTKSSGGGTKNLIVGATRREERRQDYEDDVDAVEQFETAASMTVKKKNTATSSNPQPQQAEEANPEGTSLLDSYQAYLSRWKNREISDGLSSLGETASKDLKETETVKEEISATSPELGITEEAVSAEYSTDPKLNAELSAGRVGVKLPEETELTRGTSPDLGHGTRL